MSKLHIQKIRPVNATNNSSPYATIQATMPLINAAIAVNHMKKVKLQPYFYWI